MAAAAAAVQFEHPTGWDGSYLCLSVCLFQLFSCSFQKSASDLQQVQVASLTAFNVGIRRSHLAAGAKCENDHNYYWPRTSFWRLVNGQAAMI